MRVPPLIVIGAVLFTAAGTASSQSRRTAADFVVIVNLDNPTDSVDRKFLENAFLKKLTRWPNDEVVRPVEQVARATIREKFSEEILERSVDAVKGYWQQRIFSGRDVPPPEFTTDADVVGYVKTHPGAVGYVSPAAQLDGAKVLRVN